jgi:hypothetical protein
MTKRFHVDVNVADRVDCIWRHLTNVDSTKREFELMKVVIDKTAGAAVAAAGGVAEVAALGSFLHRLGDVGIAGRILLGDRIGFSVATFRQILVHPRRR